LFHAVAGERRIAEDFETVNTLSPLTLLYSSNNMTSIIADHPSVAHSMNELRTGRTTILDVVEDLPAEMNLSLSETPVLNCESRLSLVLEPEIDAPNTEIRIILSDGFSLVSGSLQWNGDLWRNLIMRMNVSVRAEMVGSWRVEAVATSKPANDYPKICSTQCYVQVSEAEAHVFDVAPEDFTKAEAVKLDSNVSPKYVGESAGNVTVYGTWYYEDQYGRLKPVRYATVQLWADAVPSDVYLATTYVQSDGYYVFPVIANNNGSLTDGYNVYVKLFCDSSQYEMVRVVLSQNDVRKPPATYWSQTDIQYNVTDGYHDMGRWVVTGDKRECWAIYDGVVDGYFWLLNQVGWHRSKVLATAQDRGSGSYSTGNGMVFYVGDGWDRDTILHEYGHCVQYAAREGSFPPKVGPDEHYPDSETECGWAICEGWAEFFPCAVDNTTLMVGGRFGSIESTTFANGIFGHGDSGDWDGDIVEGAVAQVFWDIFDGVSPNDYPLWDEPYGDCISNEFGKLWSIFLNHDPDNIHDFWAQWTPKDASIWAVFHHARIIEPRNIAVTNVSSSQPSVALGETVYIDITVKNQGDTVENFNVTVSADGLVINSFENVTLERDSFSTFTVSWNTNGEVKGDHTISAQAIAFPRDLNATDDTNECIVTVLSLGHDVGISSIVPSKTVIGRRYSLPVAIVVRNYGIFPETFNVTASANQTIIDTFSNLSLASGYSATLALDWDTTSYSEGNYTVSVYIAPLKDEVDISDNVLTIGIVKVTIPGDVNGDFFVNNSDVDQIRLYWQQKLPSAPGNVDINGDGIIDIKDSSIIGANWQKRV
jgi:hypothetical protein